MNRLHIRLATGMLCLAVAHSGNTVWRRNHRTQGLTLDGGGGAYTGLAAAVNGTVVTLANNPYGTLPPLPVPPVYGSKYCTALPVCSVKRISLSKYDWGMCGRSASCEPEHSILKLL